MAYLQRRMSRVITALFAAALAFSFAVPTASAAREEITVLTDDGIKKPIIPAIARAFMKAYPNIRVTSKFGPAGGTFSDLIKAKLVAGKMEDVFLYNTGALFQSLDPTKNLVDLSSEPWQSTVISSFYPVVSIGAKIYGAPIGSAMGGGIFYNKAIYAKLGLKAPLTWEQFMANNATIKKAGLIPVIQTYKDSWTAQLFILADYFNVQAANPYFAAELTSHKAHFATTPAAVVGFQHLEDVKKAGYLNNDYASATFDKGIEYLATGKGAHYPMLTLAMQNIVKNYPKSVSNIGFFAQPGTSAKSNGLTVWMPHGLFIPKTTKRLEAAKKFVAFAVSPAGIAAINSVSTPTGPYLIKGVKPSSYLSVVTIDMLPYFKTNGKTAPALEFLSPLKGPNLPNIAVKVGSGIITAKEGVAAYDSDIEKEAVRLGFPAWLKAHG